VNVRPLIEALREIVCSAVFGPVPAPNRVEHGGSPDPHLPDGSGLGRLDDSAKTTSRPRVRTHPHAIVQGPRLAEAVRLAHKQQERVFKDGAK
jgi:hypothetical protein